MAVKPEDSTSSKASLHAAAREKYIEWLRETAARPRSRPKERASQAWKVAREAAQLLRERYDTTRIRVFGSLVHSDRFHVGSDVDLAVEGLAAYEYWDAVADVLFLDDEITVDVVDPETCPPDVWKTVEREGIDL